MKEERERERAVDVTKWKGQRDKREREGKTFKSEDERERKQKVWLKINTKKKKRSYIKGNQIPVLLSIRKLLIGRFRADVIDKLSTAINWFVCTFYHLFLVYVGICCVYTRPFMQ